MTAAKVPFFMAELVENLINLVVEEVSELKDLFDQTALEETWLSIVQSFKDLIVSFDDPSVTGPINFSNTTLAEKIETIHNHIISALDRINGLFDASVSLLFKIQSIQKSAAKMKH